MPNRLRFYETRFWSKGFGSGMEESDHFAKEGGVLFGKEYSRFRVLCFLVIRDLFRLDHL